MAYTMRILLKKEEETTIAKKQEPQRQQTPTYRYNTSVREGIRETSENILAWSRVLLTRIVIQIITKKQTSIVLDSVIIIAKSIAVRATKGFVIQLSN